MNHLADITDDEIESYWNLSKMAESIHNTLRGDELRKKDAAIFAATLEQTINYYKLFYNQIIDAHRLPFSSLFIPTSITIASCLI